MKRILCLFLAFLMTFFSLFSCSESVKTDNTLLQEEDDPEDAGASVPERDSDVPKVQSVELPSDTNSPESSPEIDTAEQTESDTTAKTVTETEKAVAQTAVQTPKEPDVTTAKNNDTQTQQSQKSHTHNTSAVSEGVENTVQQSGSNLLQSSKEKEETLYITKGGSYTLSGKKTDATVTVDAGDEDVQLVLNGVTLINGTGPCIYVKSADNVEIILPEGSVSRISDGASYTVTDGDSTIDGAIFSRSDLTVSGGGTLFLDGNSKHGIVSKDDLVINGGTLDIVSRNVGIYGKDCVIINAGNIKVNSGTDGIRSKNLEDTARGYVQINGGILDISAGSDGIQASAALDLTGGKATVRSGKITTADGSYKGLKADGNVTISGGEFYVHSKDDAVHSDTKS